MGKHIRQTPKEVWQHQRFTIDKLFYSDNTFDWNAGLKILLPCIEAAHKSYMHSNQETVNSSTKYRDMLAWALSGDVRITKKIVRKLARGLRGGIQHKNVLEGGITITNEMREEDSLLSCISVGKDGNITLILWSFWEKVLFEIDQFYGLTDKNVQIMRHIGTLDPKQMTIAQLHFAIAIKASLPIEFFLYPEQDSFTLLRKFRKDAMDEALSVKSDLMDSRESNGDNE